ncbi:MAG TPA: hypothetical protein VEC14_05155 [Reyranellaceae bacterium]|nr:hypothetical protein [Reyranellaceae bacterium]
MNCPYCLEPVKPEALVCRTCHRDLAVPKPLMEANQKLSERVAELEAEVARLRRFAPEPAVPAEAAPVEPVGVLGAVLYFFLVPSLGLVALHALLVLALDAPLLWLRLASIALPAAIGFWLESRHRASLWLVAILAAATAVAGVLGMSLVVHLIDGEPVLPHTRVVWRETLEYVASIGLGYGLGALLCRVLRPVRRHALPGKGGLVDRLAMLIAQGDKGASPKTLELRVERLVKMMNLGISAATAAGAIYTGLKSVIA